VPLVTFGAITAAIIAVFTIASGAIHPDPTFLMSVASSRKSTRWSTALSVGFALVAADQRRRDISIWYAVAAIAFGAKPMSERVRPRRLPALHPVPALASAHHLLADPGVSTAWKVVNTSYFMYFAVLASMIHGLTIPRDRGRAAQEGFNKGLFEWLRKAPWAIRCSRVLHLADRLRLLGGISA